MHAARVARKAMLSSWSRVTCQCGAVREITAEALVHPVGWSATFVELAERIRCSQWGKKAAEVVAAARPRPRGGAEESVLAWLSQELRGARTSGVVSPSTMGLRRAPSSNRKVYAQRRSPTRDKPYLSIDRGNLVFAATEGRPSIPLALYRSPVAGTLEILIDGQVVGSVDGAVGKTIQATIPVPKEPGRYLVVIRSKSDGRVIKGCPIFTLQGESG